MPQLPAPLRHDRGRARGPRHSSAHQRPQAEAGPPPPPGATVTTRKECFVPIARSAARSIAEVATACGSARSPAGTPRSIGLALLQGRRVRDDVLSERRLRYPMKLVDGRWNRLSWNQAIDEIGDKLLEIRAKSGPESVYWLGSAKFTNEAAYLNRKFARLLGNQQLRSPGAHLPFHHRRRRRQYVGLRRDDQQLQRHPQRQDHHGDGRQSGEAHPVSLQHILEGKELKRANMIVIDPRMTRTAAHATEYVRVRPGTHIPTIYGMLWHVFQNGWRTRTFIRQRVYGFDEVRKEIDKWQPDEVERVTGLPEAQVKRVARFSPSRSRRP